MLASLGKSVTRKKNSFLTILWWFPRDRNGVLDHEWWFFFSCSLLRSGRHETGKHRQVGAHGSFHDILLHFLFIFLSLLSMQFYFSKLAVSEFLANVKPVVLKESLVAQYSRQNIRDDYFLILAIH